MTQKMRTYDYRTPKSAAIWLFVGVAMVVTTVVLWSQQVKAREQIAAIGQSLQNDISAPVEAVVAQSAPEQKIYCSDGGMPVYDEEKCNVTIGESLADVDADAVQATSVWLKQNCTPHERGGWLCKGSQVIGIGGDGSLMVVVGEDATGYDVYSPKTGKFDRYAK